MPQHVRPITLFPCSRQLLGQSRKLRCGASSEGRQETDSDEPERDGRQREREMMRNVQPTRQWGCEVVERDRHDDGAEAQDEYQLQLPNRGDQGHYQCDDQDLANETGLGVAPRLLGYLLVHCAPVALRPLGPLGRQSDFTLCADVLPNNLEVPSPLGKGVLSGLG